MTREKKTTLSFFAYISPWLLGFACFGLFPPVYSLYISFCHYQMGGTPVFAGFQNYIDLFKYEKYFFTTLKNTFVFMTATTVFGMGLGLLFSLMINAVPEAKRFYQTVYYLPAILPFIAGTMLWESMYVKYGILNGILTTMGFDRVLFLGHKNAMKSLVVMSVWGGVGGKITMFLPAVAGVPKDLLETMDLDGANAWQKFCHVTLPMISPTIFYLLIMDIIGGLQAYGPMMMLGGGTATITATLQIYNYAMIDHTMGYASAYAWIIFLIVLAVTFVFFKFGGKKVYYVDE